MACGSGAGCSFFALTGYALVATAAVPVAQLVGYAGVTGRAPSWLVPLPDDATLAVLGAIVTGTAAFLGATTLGAVPRWLANLLVPVGTLLGVPLVVVNGMLVGFERTLGAPSTGIRLAVVVVGLALTGAWWYLLAGMIARRLGRVTA